MYKLNYIAEYEQFINFDNIKHLVLCIQKKIYLFSKKCDIRNVIKLRKYFLNQQEYYLVIIKKILKFFKQKYSLTKNYSSKLMIYLYFIIYYKYSYNYHLINLIRNKVCQYLIYLFLKADSIARYEVYSHENQNKKDIEVLKYKAHLFFNKKYLNSNKYTQISLTSKNINKENNISQIDSCIGISKKLNYLLRQQNLFKSYDLKKSKQYILFNKYENKLYELLNDILYIGLEWNIYINLQVQSIYKNIFINRKNNQFFFVVEYLNIIFLNIAIAQFLNQVGVNIYCTSMNIHNNIKKYVYAKNVNIQFNRYNNLIVKPTKISINNLFYNIRYILYAKDHKGLWRINKYTNINKVRYRINDLLYSWYYLYNNIVDYNVISQINQKVDRMFYIWQTKR
uniref:Putative group II intron reverse transcriptase/maturase protein n=1 Tax=Calliarthron tuberculosum TaxID=48942 RepID=M4IU82_CALTB|nr:putative group II intron reverse transcriptase/maturase protein [Calliarthron tuberculosum]AGA63898.1 putative group II intron reverse transcriptase/maturase protein [Calliarthron tuberculosum]